MLLMWTSTLRGRSQAGERLEGPAGTRERHVAHVVRAAVRDAEPGELVLAPERPVDEHEVAGGEAGEHAVVQPGEPGDVGDDAAARAVAEDEPARLELDVDPSGSAARRRPRRTARRRGSTLRARCAARARASATRPRSSAPASRSTGYPSVSARSTPASPKTRTGAPTRAAAAARRVVDLRVGQQHAGDRRRADAVACGARERLELLTRVGRGVDEKPWPLAPADRERRLRAGRARTPARAASHVSQWQFHCGKPPPAAEPDADAHGRALQTPTGGTGRR